MTILILESPKAAIRGQLKRWFVELRPNVFISSITATVMENVIRYLLQYGALDGLVVCSATNSQGYRIRQLGVSANRYKDIALGELSLIVNNPLPIIELTNIPF